MSKEKKQASIMEKICPLSRTNSYHGHNCLKERCPWWDDLVKNCAVLVIARFGDVGSFYFQRQKQKEMTLIEKINEDAKGPR